MVVRVSRLTSLGLVQLMLEVAEVVPFLELLVLAEQGVAGPVQLQAQQEPLEQQTQAVVEAVEVERLRKQVAMAAQAL